MFAKRKTYSYIETNKKHIGLAAVIILAISLVACGKKADTEESANVALVTETCKEDIEETVKETVSEEVVEETEEDTIGAEEVEETEETTEEKAETPVPTEKPVEKPASTEKPVEKPAPTEKPENKVDTPSEPAQPVVPTEPTVPVETYNYNCCICTNHSNDNSNWYFDNTQNSWFCPNCVATLGLGNSTSSAPSAPEINQPTGRECGAHFYDASGNVILTIYGWQDYSTNTYTYTGYEGMALYEISYYLHDIGVEWDYYSTF